MKKLIFFTSAVIVLSFSSCMKDYNCSCTDSTGKVTITTMHNTKTSCHNQCAALGSNCSIK